jgi:hypothetical protein
MGTSTPFGGGNGRNPLIPSWLGSADGAAPAAAASPEGAIPDGSAPGQDPGHPASAPGDILSPFDNRFTSARKHFNKYTRSGNGDRRALGKAIASYVSRAGGGAKTAARRMSSERQAAGRLGGLLSDASRVGIREVLRTLNLDALTDKSIVEIYAALVDVVCEPGGDLDDAFSRDAYLEAVAEVIEMNLDDLEKPSPETISLVVERFIANSIRIRMLNSIANQSIILPANVATVKAIDKEFREFIRGAVSDAMNEIGRVLNSAQMTTIIDSLFERSLSILQVYADAAAVGGEQ